MICVRFGYHGGWRSFTCRSAFLKVSYERIMRVSRLLLVIFTTFWPTIVAKIDCAKSRRQRSIVSIDFEKVREEVIDASSISTQLVNTIQWETIQAIGWSLGGTQTQRSEQK